MDRLRLRSSEPNIFGSGDIEYVVYNINPEDLQKFTKILGELRTAGLVLDLPAMTDKSNAPVKLITFPWDAYNVTITTYKYVEATEEIAYLHYDVDIEPAITNNPNDLMTDVAEPIDTRRRDWLPND